MHSAEQDTYICEIKDAKSEDIVLEALNTGVAVCKEGKYRIFGTHWGVVYVPITPNLSPIAGASV